MLLLCTIYGCAKDDSDKLYFHLESLPDIGDYTPDVEPKRWYDDYTGELIPRDDYGTLRPYCGNIVNFSEFGLMTYRMLYGLCTADGTIVTDPVYTDIDQQGEWFILRSREMRREDESTFSSFYSVSLAKTDGSVCVVLDENASGVYFIWDNLISAHLSDKVQLLDYDGNVVAEFESSYLRVNGDYLIVTEYSMSDNYQHVSLLDRSLNVIATSNYSIDLIGNKFYYTYDENDSTRIFNMQGEELFTDLNIKNFTSYVDDGIFLVADNKNAYIYDYDMNLLSSLSFSRISGIGLLGKKILKVNINNNPATYMDLEGNSLGYDSVTDLGNYYVMNTGATTYVADADLNIIAEIDGKYSGMAEDTEAGLIYLTTTGTSNPVTSAYSLEKNGFVAENVHKLYVTHGFYYRLDYNTESLAYDYNIYRARDGELVCNTKIIPSHLNLDGEFCFFAQVGDYAVTYDEDFNEISRVRINKD